MTLATRAGHLLEKAFHLADEAEWLWTAPNPRVGALALRQGHVVGRGAHLRLGGPHAEEAALRDAGAWNEAANQPLRGVVDQMVISLEPCSATGAGKRRPACTRLIADAGVEHLLVGAVDPDPRHAAAGLQQLRQAGITVELGGDAWQQRFAEQNPAFLGALARPQLPFVVLKWAASFDGKTATDDGSSQWISGSQSRAEVHALRALSDAVLAGRVTVEMDDAELSARPQPAPDPGTGAEVLQPLRVIAGLPSGDLDGARLLAATGPRLWLVAQEDARPAPAGDPVLALPPGPDGGVDLQAALQELRSQHQVRRVLVEGGPRLHGALLAAGAASAVVRYEAPLLLGGRHAALLGPSCEDPAHGWKLAHEERADLGDDLRRAFLLVGGPR